MRYQITKHHLNHGHFSVFWIILGITNWRKNNPVWLKPKEALNLVTAKKKNCPSGLNNSLSSFFYLCSRRGWGRRHVWGRGRSWWAPAWRCAPWRGGPPSYPAGGHQPPPSTAWIYVSAFSGHSATYRIQTGSWYIGYILVQGHNT